MRIKIKPNNTLQCCNNDKNSFECGDSTYGCLKVDSLTLGSFMNIFNCNGNGNRQESFL